MILIFCLHQHCVGMSIDYKKALKELRSLRSSCQRCGCKEEYISTPCGGVQIKNLQLAHRSKKKRYSINEIIRRKYPKPSLKRAAFTNSIRISFMLCASCHRLYDGSDFVKSTMFYEKATLPCGLEVEWPLWM